MIPFLVFNLLLILSIYTNTKSLLPLRKALYDSFPFNLSLIATMMQELGLERFSNDVVSLDLTLPAQTSSTSLSIDEEESTEAKIRRLISEHPVIIFSRSSCCMCHVMKRLLATIGVIPTVIELDDHEVSSLPTALEEEYSGGVSVVAPPPAVFIGRECVGGLESLVALHLSGHLVPKLVQVGALFGYDNL